ncbi:long-chain-fatty-acid--CoA ligase [Nocardioidaceae bacterium Broad-1]|nr:long-chain-fatty-acid--CoA ligase [Nocardioidaceae bacterium Broad-1]
MANLAQLLDGTASSFPDRLAIISGEDRLTFADVDKAANRIANLLVANGIQPGDKVAISCPNNPAFTAIYYGILKAGGTVLPLNILLREHEIAYHLTDADAKAYFAYDKLGDLPIGQWADTAFGTVQSCQRLFAVESLGAIVTDAPVEDAFATALLNQSDSFDTVWRDDEDTAVILYTSGTTGQPKGAELRHRNMRDNALASAAIFHSNTERPDTYLSVLPLFHSFGQTVVQNSAIAFGGTVVMMARFDAEAAIATMAREKVTFFAGVPTMYWAILAAADENCDVSDLSDTLRIAAAGGAALPVELHKRFRERFGHAVLEGYGLSETSPVASFAPIGEEPRVGSIGRPIPGVEMKLIADDWSELPNDPDAVGEIAIKGHNIMKGYFGRPEATGEVLREGWFRSGDLARRDADGYYYIVDRSKDLIIRGGFNVYPREIEELLMTHPAVSLVAVVGVPHEAHGEEIKAFAVLNKGAEVTEPELIEWCKERVAAYKYPRAVSFVDSLPTTSTGKLLKRMLTEA